MKRIVLPMVALLVIGIGAVHAAGPGTATEVEPADQVFLVGSDGQGLRKLTTGPRGSRSPAWSPDGRRLAYTSSGRKRRVIEIWSVQSGKSRRVAITRRLGSPSEPQWSPRRNELAFSAFRELRNDLRRAVAIVRADGSKPRRVAEDEFGRVVASGPVWSPDGESIAYIRQRKTRSSDFPDRGPLQPVPTTTALDMVVASRSGGKRRIPLRGDEFDPRWSPDGKWILIVREAGQSRYVLAKVSTGGGRLRRVASGLIGPIGAEWSPHGRSVAFAGTTAVGDRHPHLYVADPRGGAPRQIAAAGEVALVRPTWSPDGKLLAFADFNGRLRAIAPDGSGERTLVTLPGADFFDIEWSPDGRWIAFVAAKHVEET